MRNGREGRSGRRGFPSISEAFPRDIRGGGRVTGNTEVSTVEEIQSCPCSERFSRRRVERAPNRHPEPEGSAREEEVITPVPRRLHSSLV